MSHSPLTNANKNGQPEPWNSHEIRPCVNVIIPIYRGLDETRRCLESVMASGLGERVFVTLINDASPEPEMRPLLEQYAGMPLVTLLHNPVNLGFVATVNRGMALHPQADVVLLNSDTEVPARWLERLQRCAYAAPEIGTVTPFSNNATICSYPQFCSDNLIPHGFSVETLDALFSEANANESVDIPTAVGFCMYIRRDCLDQTGLFDEARFGKGYGEENDFCLRATAKGWRHALCADTFVFHAGSVSFSHERDERAQKGLELVIERHPRYPVLVQKHISKDPAKRLRQRVDLLRVVKSEAPVVLLVSHRLGGGVVKHEQELSRLFKREVNFLRLTPGLNGQVEISWNREGEPLRLHFLLPNDWSELVDFLRLARVIRIHFHHLMDMPLQIEGLPQALAVAYDFTVHDYFSICPRVTLTRTGNSYCGEPSEDGCNACLRNAPSNQRDIRTWRSHYESLLAGAERVFVPSHDVAARLNRYFRLPNLIVSPHADMQGQIPTPAPCLVPPAEPLRIVVIGALSAIKGAELLESVALDAKSRGLLLEFHLIGHALRKLVTKPKSLLTTSQAYRDDELQGLLKAAKPDLIWFPALWPETYSYTLSAALISGLPVVAPDLGAFPERLAGRPWSWICPWNQSPGDWNNFFVHLREAHFLSGTPPHLFSRRPENTSVDLASIYLRTDRASTTTASYQHAITRFADTQTIVKLPLIRRAVIDMRGRMLRMGLTLRSHPSVGKLIRRVPLHWQHRVRQWLVK